MLRAQHYYSVEGGTNDSVTEVLLTILRGKEPVGVLEKSLRKRACWSTAVDGQTQW